MSTRYCRSLMLGANNVLHLILLIQRRLAKEGRTSQPYGAKRSNLKSSASRTSVLSTTLRLPYLMEDSEAFAQFIQAYIHLENKAPFKNKIKRPLRNPLGGSPCPATVAIFRFQQCYSLGSFTGDVSTVVTCDWPRHYNNNN